MRTGKNSKNKGGDKDQGVKGRDKKEAGGIKMKQFKSETRKKWATKNQRKREKELKEIDKEMKEAEAEVDVEERAQVVSLGAGRLVGVLGAMDARPDRY